MTGFARVEGALAGDSWCWELKSVNGRGLEVRMRLPSGFERLERDIRASASGRFARGSINIQLQYQPAATETGYRINRALLQTLLDLVAEHESAPNLAPARLDGLLAVRGVVEAAENDAGDSDAGVEAGEARLAAMLADFNVALDRLAEARREEGARLAEALGQHVDEIALLVAQVRNHASRTPEALRQRLRDQIAALLDANAALPEERLAQELAMLATKADIAEELDRLDTHIAAARDLLGKDGPNGRRLDFLCQEFNREANTVCSKAFDGEVTRIGLELKVTIDRFREQIQNIE
ncbi:hypothetical protein OCH7691_02089 [Oceanibacterium hippocampi]|uniref:YicC-like family, N-terminal region n=2 Tax=Oceanibacterium hippocampi TaxID=745714 RepID=A0A1Y5STN5_9PROT|nr:hypothetical protein OCH7691_02089 [Oceanibacterium hippocampi]